MSIRKPPSGCTQACSDCLDRILTNQFLAFPIFLVVIYLLFSCAFGKHFLWMEGLPGPGIWMADLVKRIWGLLTKEIIVLAERVQASEWSVSLAKEWLGGIGAWMECLPPVLVWYLLLSFLEDSGYMARAAFMMDRILCRFGLSGCSVLPLLLGFGCPVPALRAAGALHNEQERNMTMMLIPFMPCSAKIPVCAMIAAEILEGRMQTAMLILFYLLGIAAALLEVFIVRRFVCRVEMAYGMIEMPKCCFPEGKRVLMHGWSRTKEFAVKSGPIVAVSGALFWLLSHFGPEGMCRLDDSFLALFGRAVRWMFVPLGWEDWRASAGAAAGWIAKENLVVILGQWYPSVHDLCGLKEVKAGFDQAAAYSYMVFQLFAMPCLAAAAAMRRWTGSWRRTLRIIGYQMLHAYMAAWGIHLIVSFFSCK